MKRDSKPKRRSPVKKFMDRLTRPATHKDKTKYERRKKHKSKDETQDTT